MCSIAHFGAHSTPLSILTPGDCHGFIRHRSQALDSVITVAGALAAIFGGIAGVAGLATFLGTGGGS
ncbi:hypothetical protein A2J01_07480 [Rhodococcus sp. EPR-134]|nr:hypothetical protein A2J01_07480 [Rhodococcus sp. EPR-134]